MSLTTIFYQSLAGTTFYNMEPFPAEEKKTDSDAELEKRIHQEVDTNDHDDTNEDATTLPAALAGITAEDLASAVKVLNAVAGLLPTRSNKKKKNVVKRSYFWNHTAQSECPRRKFWLLACVSYLPPLWNGK